MFLFFNHLIFFYFCLTDLLMEPNSKPGFCGKASRALVDRLSSATSDMERAVLLFDFFSVCFVPLFFLRLPFRLHRVSFMRSLLPTLSSLLSYSETGRNAATLRTCTRGAIRTTSCFSFLLVPLFFFLSYLNSFPHLLSFILFHFLPTPH